MLLRRSPFTKTCRNLYFNVLHYKPSYKRPSFKAANHPFCTNTQLLESSYTNWIKQTSKGIPTKLFNNLNENASEEREHSKDSIPHYSSLSTCINNDHRGSSVLNDISIEEKETNKNAYATSDILRQLRSLAQIGETSLLSNKIEELKLEDVIIPPQSIIDILDEVISNTPHRNILPLQSEIESARHRNLENMNIDSPYYNYIYKHIPHLYKICRSYENIITHEKRFHEHYIWLCYHMDDIDTLQPLIYAYLKNSNCDSKVLSYIMSSFISNYEVEFSKNLFQNLLVLGGQVQPNLLENVLFQLVKVDSLFENLVFILQTWVKNTNCPPPSAKSMAILLKEYHKYGTEEEKKLFNSLIESYNLSNNHIIRAINLQEAIISRQATNFKKSIQENDFEEINCITCELKNSGSLKELSDVYYSFLDFFVRYSNIENVHILAMKMKKDNVPLDEEFFRVMSKYYVKNNKFLQLFSLLKDTSNKISFNDVYLKNLYESFIKTYPYHSEHFDDELKSWVKCSTIIPTDKKTKYLNCLNIRKVQSQLTPYSLKRDILNSKKYDSENWKEILWQQDRSGKAIRFSDQINFRINKGFRDILRKGIKPDVRVIESTFRRLNVDNRNRIMEILKYTRLLNKEVQKLNIYNLQMDSSKEDILQYMETYSAEFNLNNKLKLGRLLTNKGLFRESEVLLSSLNPEDMMDRSLMVKLNFQLRNYLSYSRFDEMIRIIDEFPINSIILSPYIHKQCCYIEKLLKRKMKIVKLKEAQEQRESQITKIDTALSKLRGLIGDIQIRLDQDKVDIDKLIKEMIEFLDRWISVKDDERKI